MRKSQSDRTRENIKKVKVNIHISIITILKCLPICRQTLVNINSLNIQTKYHNTIKIYRIPTKMLLLIHIIIIPICIRCINLNILEIKRVMIILLITKKIRVNQEKSCIRKNRKDKSMTIICHTNGHTITLTICLPKWQPNQLGLTPTVLQLSLQRVLFLQTPMVEILVLI